MAVFHMNDGTEFEAFINIGWFFDEQSMPVAVRRAATGANLKDEQWHSVTAYGRTFTKKQLNDITKGNVRD